ncbi:class I SAM-dependent methyltransferase [Mangrovicoccus sp. HB161399]|uniref:class I SAM-dependent DNA methyltransferase n=1 Tax=Mangrovicoccus sp. HB161399 TaxID=2720392 RepID=UPI001556C202|nr:class I SAM-dependent methyltransferase [Mangrovicoccus sp. HB161399]
MNSRPDAETIALYDAQAREYGDRFGGTKPYPRLEAFLDQVRPGGRVLDLGCGPGHASARMRERGFVPVPLDASGGMAAEAARRYGLDVTVADFSAIPGLGRFDGAWAHFSLLHADPADLPGHLADIHAALDPGAPFLIAMKTGTGTARDRIGRRYAYVGKEQLADLLARAGFSGLEIDTGADEGFDGTLSNFAIVTAHA